MREVDIKYDQDVLAPNTDKVLWVPVPVLFHLLATRERVIETALCPRGLAGVEFGSNPRVNFVAGEDREPEVKPGKCNLQVIHFHLTPSVASKIRASMRRVVTDAAQTPREVPKYLESGPKPASCVSSSRSICK